MEFALNLPQGFTVGEPSAGLKHLLETHPWAEEAVYETGDNQFVSSAARAAEHASEIPLLMATSRRRCWYKARIRLVGKSLDSPVEPTDLTFYIWSWK